MLVRPGSPASDDYTPGTNHRGGSGRATRNQSRPEPIRDPSSIIGWPVQSPISDTARAKSRESSVESQSALRAFGCLFVALLTPGFLPRALSFFLRALRGLCVEIRVSENSRGNQPRDEKLSAISHQPIRHSSFVIVFPLRAPSAP